MWGKVTPLEGPFANRRMDTTRISRDSEGNDAPPGWKAHFEKSGGPFFCPSESA